jgi:hypothetical protein
VTTWYLAFCVQCNGGIDKLIAADKTVMPMPFEEKAARTTWVDDHMESTGHAMLLLNQQGTATTTTATTTTKEDADDATT